MPDYALVWANSGESMRVRDPHVSDVLGPVSYQGDLVTFDTNTLALLELGNDRETILRVLWSYALEEEPLLRDLRFWNQKEASSTPILRQWNRSRAMYAFVHQYMERHEVPFAKFRMMHFAATPKDWLVVPTTMVRTKSSFILLSPDQKEHFLKELKNKKRLGYVWPGSANHNKGMGAFLAA